MRHSVSDQHRLLFLVLPRRDGTTSAAQQPGADQTQESSHPNIVLLVLVFHSQQRVPHLWITAIRDRLLGEVPDPAFGPAFFAIWLDAECRYPKVRDGLAGSEGE